MDTQGKVIIWGSLAVLIGLIVGGAYLGSGVGNAMLAVGLIGGIAWLIGVFSLLSMMNTDI